VSRWKGIWNFVFIQLGRYCPSLSLKNGIYRHALGMKIGDHAAIGLMAMMDVFFPERISIGNNSIIGYNTTILAHEYLIGEYRLGDVQIGSQVMIGANCTILPGVTIGDGAVVSAGTLVHKNVPAGAFVGGNPMRIIRTAAQSGSAAEGQDE